MQKYVVALNKIFHFIDGWYDELNEYGGLSCSFWGKFSNCIYKLAREERHCILFIVIYGNHLYFSFILNL